LAMLGIYCVAAPAVVLGFLLPMSELVRQAYYGLKKASLSDFTGPIWDSVSLAAQASFLIMCVSLFLAYTYRKIPHFMIRM